MPDSASMSTRGKAGLAFFMLDVTKSLPEDPAELRAFTALLLAEVKSQAVLIAKLQHQLAGQRVHRFRPSSETSEQLQLALEMSEIELLPNSWTDFRLI